MRNSLYMAVTNDEFELPLVVAESRDEFAMLCGKSKDFLSQCACHNDCCKILGVSSKILRIKLEPELEE